VHHDRAVEIPQSALITALRCRSSGTRGDAPTRSTSRSAAQAA
jgi:hypothetical protein